MSSVRTRSEESCSDDENRSSSLADYTRFCTISENLKTVVQNSKPTDFEGDPAANDCRPIDSEVKVQSIWHRVFRSQCCKYTDVIVTVLLVALVWMMMAIPTVMYIRTKVKKPHSVVDEKNVTCTLYNDSYSNYCTTYLQQYTNCLSDSVKANDKHIYISGPLNKKRIREADTFIGELRSKSLDVRAECLMLLEPFVCLYHIQLCDKHRDLATIAPSRNQCTYISNVCDEELKMFKNVDKYLSMCGPESPLDSTNCTIVESNSSQINCNRNFFYEDQSMVCKPVCGMWTLYTKENVLVINILTIFPSSIGAVTGVMVLLISLLHRRKLCRYPSIFVIYQTIPAIVIAVIVLIGYSAQKRLFCSSENFLESFKYPTPFCTISGIVFYYILTQQLLWWLWHTIAVFWSVYRPFHAKKFIKSKKHRYLHVVFVLASVTLPIAPTVIVSFASSKSYRKGFTLSQSPAIICTGLDLDTNFWAVLFPMSIVLATGSNLLVFILRIVVKNHLLSKIYKVKMVSGWTLEFKVLLVLCYYVIIGTAVLSIFTHDLLVLNNQLDTFIEYFYCEAQGLLPNSNKPRCTDLEMSIQSVLNPIPTAIALLILGFLPAVNLVYIVKFSDVKRNMKTYSHTRYMKYIQDRANRAGHYIPNLINEWKSTTLRRGSLKAPTTSFTTEPLITPQVDPDSQY